MNRIRKPLILLLTVSFVISTVFLFLTSCSDNETQNNQDNPSADTVAENEEENTVTQVSEEEEQLKTVTDPKEFAALFINALREGDADTANLLCGEKRFSSLTADKSLEKDPYAEGDGCNRLITVEDGYIVCENVSGSDVYFTLEGDCLGYALYVRKAGDRFVIEAVGKYASEFALCDAENYLRFPYTEEFRVFLYNGAPAEYYYSDAGFRAEYSYPKDTLENLIVCAMKKGDFTTLKHLCRNLNFGAAEPTDSDEPVVVSSMPFGFDGRAKDVSIENEIDLTHIITVTTEQNETVKLKAELQKNGDGYMISTLEVAE